MQLGQLRPSSAGCTLVRLRGVGLWVRFRDQAKVETKKRSMLHSKSKTKNAVGCFDERSARCMRKTSLAGRCRTGFWRNAKNGKKKAGLC